MSAERGAKRSDRWALNPIAWKDLLAHARTPGAGTRHLLAMGFAAPLLILAWCAASLPGRWREVPPFAFLAVSGLLALVGLTVAIPASTAFALERDRDTLEGLVVSPLTPRRIVLGKLLASLGIGASALCVLLPLLGMAFVLGGGDLAFVPQFILLVLATSTSYASFCLLVGARRLEPPGRAAWVRAQATQAQMALQATLGVGILVTLGPVYATLLVPVAAAQGLPVAAALDKLAPLAGLHPLLALLAWGDARLFGVDAPVWLVGAAFHLLLALPLLADASEAQRAEGEPPTKATRLLVLPALGLFLLLAGATAWPLPQPARAVIGLVVPAVVLIGAAMRMGFVPPGRAPRVTRRRLLLSLRPDLAFESAPDRAPGYLLVLALVCAPLVVGLCGQSGWVAVGALALTATSLAAVGARLVAGGQAADDAAFERVVRAAAGPHPVHEGDAVPAVPPPDQQAELAAQARLAALVGDEGRPADDESRAREEAAARGPRGRFFGRLLVVCLGLPALAGLGISLAGAGAPAMAPLLPALRSLATVGLALNPFAGVLVGLADPVVSGTPVLSVWLSGLGIEPRLVLAIHLLVYGAALLFAVGSLHRPHDPAEALALLAAARAAPVGPETAHDDAPPGPPQEPTPAGGVLVAAASGGDPGPPAAAPVPAPPADASPPG